MPNISTASISTRRQNLIVLGSSGLDCRSETSVVMVAVWLENLAFHSVPSLKHSKPKISKP